MNETKKERDNRLDNQYKFNLNKRSQKENLSNFSKKPSGYGHAVLTYQSAKTGKAWSKTIETNSNLFHNVFEVEKPTLKALNDLKRYIKSSQKNK